MMDNGMSEKEWYQRYLAGREWGLLKRAVRERCGGICERCNHNPMDQVHHLTYIRKYHERLEDLQAICEPCHKFTHGLSDHDPKIDVPVIICGRKIQDVYLAGKITANQWRNAILFPGTVRSGFPEQDIYEGSWIPLFSSIKLSDGRSLTYMGPFFVGEEHVGMSPTGHASDCSGNGTDLQVIDRCLTAITESDLVFAWIDSPDCFGTIAEIGYARSLDKLIFIASPVFIPDLWFVYGLAHRVSFGATIPGNAFHHMMDGDGEPFADWRQYRTSGWHSDPIDDPDIPEWCSVCGKTATYFVDNVVDDYQTMRDYFCPTHAPIGAEACSS